MQPDNPSLRPGENENARSQTIQLSTEELMAFWRALNAAPSLTPAQKRLAKIMQGSP
jgi:hypothetical protein